MIKQLTAMPKYEEYKDSGVEWLEYIPEHWDSKRLKSEIDLLTGYPFSSNKYTAEGIKLARGINVKEGVFDWKDTCYWPEISDFLKPFLLADGDVLIGMDGSKVGKNFCYVCKEDLPILLLQRVARLRGKDNLNNRFLFWNIANYKFLHWVNISKTDPMVPHIAPKDIQGYPVSLPPVNEQITIAAFLDRKTAQIDQAVAIKEKQIALLKEHKQILIQNAVTRGLNPDAPMRDSGVEWIGELPAHWEVKKLKYVAGDFMYGTSVDCNELGAGTPVLRIPNIGELDISLEDLKYASLTEAETNRYLLKKNDILIVRTNGNPNLVGKSAIFAGEEDYMFASYLIRVKPKINIEPRFLIHAMNSFSIRGSLTHSSRTSAGNYNLNTQALGDCYLAYPSKEEQTGIVAHIETASAKIDKAIAIQQQQIDKLKEYKATLIDSAVTGKIKVPELVEGRGAELTEAPMPEPIEGELVEDSMA